MKPRIILFGTPEFAEQPFRALLASGEYDIPLLITQPDRPSGRGLELTPPPVKRLAQEFGKEVLQPVSLKGISHGEKLTTTNEKNLALCETLNALAPVDLFVVVAYGKIIPKALLDFPRLGALNIHGSLLPRWRGAAPIHRALAAGDRETGVCLMQLEEGLDTGPVFSQRRTELSESDNLKTVHDRLATLGTELLLADLPRILSGELKSTPQASPGITYAEKWERPDMEIDWSAPGTETVNRIRASYPARTTLRGEVVKIFAAALSAGSESPPGTVVSLDAEGIRVALSPKESLLIKELQLSGRKRLPASEVIRGRGIQLGDRFGS